jgi:hypothetical protein
MPLVLLRPPRSLEPVVSRPSSLPRAFTLLLLLLLLPRQRLRARTSVLLGFALGRVAVWRCLDESRLRSRLRLGELGRDVASLAQEASDGSSAFVSLQAVALERGDKQSLDSSDDEPQSE